MCGARGCLQPGHAPPAGTSGTLTHGVYRDPQPMQDLDLRIQRRAPQRENCWRDCKTNGCIQLQVARCSQPAYCT
jgi:hypothetical protein